MTRNVSTDRRALIDWLDEAGIKVISVGKGPRGTLKVAMVHGDENREKIPHEFEGRGVIVTFHDKGSVARLGASPAFPDLVHEVKQVRYKGGGWVARWRCERGRGEVYGALLMTEMPKGATMCPECVKV